jgi:L-fuculose-phosphate aldolase
MTETEHRIAMVAACQTLECDGLNHGAMGNVSVRMDDAMLITPSAVASDDLTPDMIAKMTLADADGAWHGPRKPSSEWRFHQDILQARPDINAVVHTHAPFSTVLAVARRPIPAVHYVMAAFGGPDIRVAEYARYGTSDLSAHILTAMEGRLGCLMANHGMLVGGADLTRALWLAGELETLAMLHYRALAIGGGHVLSDAQIAETATGFQSYGLQSEGATR